MGNMKKLIQETIAEMIENADLQFETDIINDGYSKHLVTTVYYYPDEANSARKIQEYKVEI